MSLLLVRYSELALKSPRVRSRFQNRLIANIENAFLKNELECTIDHDWGRIYIYPQDEKKGIELLRHIFGIVSISPVTEITSELDNISSQTVEITNGEFTEQTQILDYTGNPHTVQYLVEIFMMVEVIQRRRTMFLMQVPGWESHNGKSSS